MVILRQQPVVNSAQSTSRHVLPCRSPAAAPAWPPPGPAVAPSAPRSPAPDRSSSSPHCPAGCGGGWTRPSPPESDETVSSGYDLCRDFRCFRFIFNVTFRGGKKSLHLVDTTAIRLVTFHFKDGNNCENFIFLVVILQH